MKQRNVSIDVLKGIGILLVIVGHLNHFIPSESPVRVIIYSFHMPLFVIASGYIFASKAASDMSVCCISSEYIHKKFQSLVVPYAVFAVFSLLIELPSDTYTVKDMLIGVFAGGGGEFSRVGNVAIWFLPMFFLSSVIFSTIHTISFSSRIPPKYRLVVLCVLTCVLSALGYFMTMFNAKYHWLWSLDVSLFVLPFFLVGYLFYFLECKLEDKNHNGGFMLIFAACAVCWLLSMYMNGRVDLNGRKIGNVFLYYLGGISGTLLFYLISKYVLEKIAFLSSFLAWCGRNSLVIMGTHIPVAMIIYGGLKDYLPFSQYVWCADIRGVLYILFYDIIFISILIHILPFGSKKSKS